MNIFYDIPVFILPENVVQPEKWFQVCGGDYHLSVAVGDAAEHFTVEIFGGNHGLHIFLASHTDEDFIYLAFPGYGG